VCIVTKHITCSEKVSIISLIQTHRAQHRSSGEVVIILNFQRSVLPPICQKSTWRLHCRRCSRWSPTYTSVLIFSSSADSDDLRWGSSSSRSRPCWNNGKSWSWRRWSRSRESSSGCPERAISSILECCVSEGIPDCCCRSWWSCSLRCRSCWMHWQSRSWRRLRSL
jgi:hypothetical protein